MEINNIATKYNEQRNRHCKTLEDIVMDAVEYVLQVTVSDIDNLIDDIKTGRYSNEEVMDRLEEMRKQII